MLKSDVGTVEGYFEITASAKHREIDNITVVGAHGTDSNHVVAASEYSVDDMRYLKLYPLLKSNIRGASKKPVCIDALCARAEYSQVRERLFEIQPRIEASDIMCEVQRLFEGKMSMAGGEVGERRIKAIAYLMGHEYATRAIQTLTMIHIGTALKYASINVAEHTQALQGLCAERADQINVILVANPIPFKYMAVEDATALIGPYRRAEMSEEEWYGEYWRGKKSGAAASAAASSVAAASSPAAPARH